MNAGPHDLVVAGGTVLGAGTRGTASIGIRNGRIAAIAAGPLDGRRVLDATGLVVLPGVIDCHVHFREPGLTAKEDFATGGTAALLGGVTTVLEIQNNEPLVTDAAIAREKLALAAGKCPVNFGIYGNVGTENLALLAALAESVAAFKVFMTQSTGPLTVTGNHDLRAAMRAVAATGRVLAIHAEDDAIVRAASAGVPDHPASHATARPPVAEWVAVAAAIELGRDTGCAISIPHVSTARAVTLIARAKADGADVTAGTCPHYLFFTDADVGRVGNALKVNPPIKSAADRAALLDGLRSGVLDHVASDHAPHLADEKARNYRRAPSGIPGVQHMVSMMLDLVARGEFTLERAAELMTAGPAAAFGLTDRGVLRPGAHADLTLVDPHRLVTVEEGSLASRCGHSPYVGRDFRGAPVAVVLGGEVVLEDGQPAVANLRGRVVDACRRAVVRDLPPA